MGERKGQNKYYPPDYDPKKGGLNKFRGTHALRERARKIHLGIIIIRFEMPYNIWCDGCKNHIGMGVRYNAEKTKVGMYYSTPIYKFRMKCHLCENHIEMQTDPANLDYIILSGARRQENRWDPIQNEQVVPETKEVQKRLADDAMYKLEHQEKDIKVALDAKPILEKLYQRNSIIWDDNYEANCRLREEFRKTKKEIKVQKELDEKLLAKSSLEITLLPETAQDKQMASLMKLQSRSAQEHESERRLDLLMQSILPGATKTTFGGLKRLKVLNTQLQPKDLGIKKKSDTADVAINDGSSNVKTTTAKLLCDSKDAKEENEPLSDSRNSVVSSVATSNNDSEVEVTLLDFPKGLSSICDYASSSSGEESQEM
ncbi:coiled-coil domain-containing protein 130 homolog [Teleopsis dalmanni]|uniref:coiled-coil domain-containing protein 130 homolog n=1 Tax=Teleopsis dalmanni TaxID=139649 RepID=UPI0018CF0419|nr:coiled-coil domain-containing protein 130 homolog [Teleopsis dalmanni]